MERLEKINDKINNEIDRKNSLIAQLEKDYSVLKGENENLLKLNASLKA